MRTASHVGSVGVPGIVAIAVVVASTLVAPAENARALVVIPLNRCAGVDHGAPVVDLLSLDRQRIDVRRQGRTLLIDATFRDTGGPGPAVGVTSAEAYATSEDGSAALTATMRQLEGEHWRGALRFPRGVRPGVWTVGARPVDGVGLFPGYFTGSPLTPQVRSVRVVAREDTKPPVATAVDLSPASVDVRAAARRVRVDVEARDAMSGVKLVHVSLTRENQQVFVTHEADLHRVAGSAKAGRWTGHVDLPRFSRRGWWRADLKLVDRTGNARSYRSDSKDSRPAGLRSVRVLSDRDRVPPEATRVTTSATFVDVRTASGTVIILARIRDAGSGVASASAWIQRDRLYEYEVPMRLVSGTRSDGMWRGSWTVTTCNVQAGMRTISVLAKDRTDNRGDSGTPAPSLTIQNDDHLGPWITESELTATATSLRFSEDVYGISSASASLSDGAADAGTPAIVGSWQCANNAAAPVDCQVGPVRTARFIPDSPFTALYLLLVINPEHVLDVTDGAGNPYFTVVTTIGYPSRG